MKYREVEMTDVIVVLDELDDQQTLAVVEQLKTIGLSVESVDNDTSVVEGCIETARLHGLHAVTHVRYVRTVLGYACQKPVEGDPTEDDDEDRYDE